MLKIISVVGARPNFIKIAPVHKAFQKHSNNITHLICHTGQHSDKNMSMIIFEELELQKPDFYLGISGGSHSEHTSKIMEFSICVFLKISSTKMAQAIVAGRVCSEIHPSL